MTAVLERPKVKRAEPPIRFVGEQPSSLGKKDNGGFDVNVEIMRVIALHKNDAKIDTDAMVEEVLRDIPAWNREKALRQLLTTAVKRMSHPGTPETLGGARNNPTKGQNKSDKWDDVSDATKDPLRYQVRVRGELMYLGDCSAEDVRWMHEKRADAAKKMIRAARKYRQLHKAMIEAEAETVADLGSEAVAELMK